MNEHEYEYLYSNALCGFKLCSLQSYGLKINISI